MDSLKWVFIGIAIFIFLLIILSVVYWFMFGSSNASTVSNTENTVRDDDMNRMNPEINPYPIENHQEQYLNEVPYQNISGDIDNKDSSIFSSLSSPFSSKVNVEPVVEMPVEPVVEMPVEPVVEMPVEPVVEMPVEPLDKHDSPSFVDKTVSVINSVVNSVSRPVSNVPVNVIEEVKK
jgi:hypothetical protein